ncbi:MAG: Gfo/Idh/MocA family oxidoreductase [Lentisphaeria bacterium]|nr:Gfo/Idh/MocA family oxidoreductase [Lentisphaeria bacterium]
MNGKVIGGAVIGYGGMGNFHSEKMQSVEGVGLLGVYDIDPERNRAAEEKGIRAYASREELLADPQIELVTVATPNDVHREIVIAALAAGKNVICEKPVSMDSAELEEMIAAAKRHGKLFTVHQNRRWDEDFLTMRKIVEAGELGNVFRIESRVHGSRGIPGGWREEREHGGGMVLDWGVHLLDQMLTMMQGRRMVSVYATLDNITNFECDEGFTALVRFENGPEWLVEVKTCNYIEMPRWYAFGDSGSAIIRNWDCEGEIAKIYNRGEDDVPPVLAGAGLTRTMAPRNEKTVEKFPVVKVKSDWAEYYRNVIAVLNGKAEIVVTHDQLRRSMKLIEAVFESARRNEVIRF